MSRPYEIKMITAEETFLLRKNVLKPFLSHLEQCRNPGDDDETTFHMGLFHSGKLISVATFLQESYTDFPARLPYRLRGMATDNDYRQQGFGQKLLRQGLVTLQERSCNLLWFNAREKAFPFYEKMGFEYYGPLFEMKDIGPHKVMYKVLIPS